MVQRRQESYRVIKQRNVSLQVQISYMEIYNEIGFDLLDHSREMRTLDDLPRVQALEDEEGELHLRNLALHKATSEEHALNLVSCRHMPQADLMLELGGPPEVLVNTPTTAKAWNGRKSRNQSASALLTPVMRSCGCTQLFLGDTNRAISSTPINPASSRSHCIFTMLIELRKVTATSSQQYTRVEGVPKKALFMVA